MRPDHSDLACLSRPHQAMQVPSASSLCHPWLRIRNMSPPRNR